MPWIARAASIIGLGLMAGSSFAQGDSGAVIAELIQKGTSGASEDGLCERTGWPVRDRAELFPRYKEWMSGARPGSAPWQWRSSTGCTTAVIVSTGSAGGRECLRTRTFVCTIGGVCVSTPADWCPTGSGDFERCACG